MSNVILYSTKCPKCKVVELKLKQANINFELIEDVDEVVKVGQANGISSAPILMVDGKAYDFTNAINFIKGVN